MIRLLRLFAQTPPPYQPPIPTVTPSNVTLQNILSYVFGVAGAVALLMVVIGGLRYTISRGNPEEINKAKNTILYAIVGLVIALTGFSIVTFVVGRL